MCTVTIIPIGENDFVLTSNRDEAPDRVSLVPDFYTIADTKLLFPKDKMGGTWIGVSENNRVVCVLNGSFVKHKRQSSYRKSRGIVANDFMVSKNIIETVEGYNFNDIEPFTIVIADWNSNLKFYELVWDGKYKHFTALPFDSRIWSSSTLYSEGMQRERQQWFENFEVVYDLNADSVLGFHKNTDIKNMDYGVIMDRGFVKTTSVTQVEKKGNMVSMRYENLENKKVTIKTFSLPEVVNG
ncbi:MAG: NRDE family protein [Algibacter sp.]|uniref:NRDE family protein n=1 Tax=Algibacter sp. TaxID=1872428 RepID=UPI002625442D|nr:NRDE family protein [Algibacter sp.]MDG1729564.1 NRDE family protein [Algibacter sp.]MDG2179425.1 NRDE family protein [Algibacter sp.]